jgi:uncharacterized membrane protein
MNTSDRPARATLLSVIAGSALTLSASAGTTIPRYTLTDLGVLPGGTRSYAFGINNAGVIVGGATYSGSGGQVTPVVFSTGQIHTIGPNGAFAVARGINNSNQIVGEIGPHFAFDNLQGTEDLGQGGFTWKPSVVGAPFPLPSHPNDPFFNGPGTFTPQYQYQSLNGVTDNGIQVGNFLELPSSGAVLRRAGFSGFDSPSTPGSYGIINNLTGPSTQSRVYGVTAGGLATGFSTLTTNGVGRHAFASTGAGLVDLPADPRLGSSGGNSRGLGATDVLAPHDGFHGLNAAAYGAVAGWAASVDGNPSAAVWRLGPDHSPQFFAKIPGADDSEAWAINNQGIAVGHSTIRTSGQLHASAFIAGQTYDLNTLAANPLNSTDPLGNFYQLSIATAINDKGQIVGYGIGKTTAVRAFLLDPVPFASFVAGSGTGQHQALKPSGPLTNSAYSFSNVASGSWVDPATADDLHYVLTTPGAHVTSITLPDNFTGLSIVVDGDTILSGLAPLSRVTFNYDVTQFDVVGFASPLNVDQPGFFALKLEFDVPTSDLRLEALTAAVPEPAGVMLGVAAALSLARRRRPRRG